MKLIIDSGNTSINFALFGMGDISRSSKPLAHYALSNQGGRTAEEYLFWLKCLMELDKLSLFAIEEVAIASVVPEALEVLCVFSEKHLGISPLIVSRNSDGLSVTLNDKITEPRSVGADRLANAEASVRFYEGLRVVIDFGTATTFDVIAVDNTYLGGIVSPGLELSRKILATNTAKLPWIDLSDRPQALIGTSTVSAMSSGLVFGSVAMVEGLIAGITKELSQKPDIVIATGGMGLMIAEMTSSIHLYDAFFTLRGICAIAQDKPVAG